jgi:hypothetical protein
MGKATSPEFIWKEVEIMGNTQHSREEILAHIPLRLGEPFVREPERWNKWCAKLVDVFDFHDATAGAMRGIDGTARLSVEIVERGAEHRSHFRSAPTGLTRPLPDSVRSLYDDLVARGEELFEQRKVNAESGYGGYLDYADLRMHKVVLQLIKTVPPHRKTLLDTVANDRDANKRATAATMLHWAGETTKSIAVVHRLLDDPDYAVRNNISRFMNHYLDRLESRDLRQRVIDALLVQLDRPSGSDRNKAIYGLRELAQSFEVDRAYIAHRGLDVIRYMARNSLAGSFVCDPAKEILELIE